MSTTEVLQKYSSFGLYKTKISRWLKLNDAILTNAVGQAKNMYKVILAKKYNELFKDLRTLFLEAREKKHKVDFNWLQSKARVIYR